MLSDYMDMNIAYLTVAGLYLDLDMLDRAAMAMVKADECYERAVECLTGS